MIDRHVQNGAEKLTPPDMTTSQVVIGSLRLCQKQYHTALFRRVWGGPAFW
jgi:hypothetical protein